MANQSSQVKWSYKYQPKYLFFFDFLTNWYYLIPWQFTYQYLFNLTLSNSDLLLIIFAIIINGQLKQPSKMELHIWKWPFIIAMSSGVKLHLILGMILYQVISSFLFSKILILKNTGSISIQVRFWNKKYQYQYLEI